MDYTKPLPADFRAQFARDFPFARSGDTPEGANLDKVYDADITSALAAAGVNFNVGLFTDQTSYAYCFNLLAAHYLVQTLISSAQGIQGQGEWLVQQKSAGNVSEAFAIPEYIQKHPSLALLSKTRYGQQYLELMLPKMIGNIITVFGPTKP